MFPSSYQAIYAKNRNSEYETVKIPDIIISNFNFFDILFFFLILFLINIKILIKKVILVIIKTNKERGTTVISEVRISIKKLAGVPMSSNEFKYKYGTEATNKIPDIIIDNSNFFDIFIFLFSFLALILFLINIKILIKKVIAVTTRTTKEASAI